MESSRQQAFQRLRPPCVELSSIALKLKANQTSAKSVLLALEQVHRILCSLGEEDLLDEKLAEYAFFPLTHVFNQSSRISSRGLELAVKCVQILVSRGWRDKLLPEMAKQLLLLMGLLVSRGPDQQNQPPTEELKIASFECMAVLIRQSASLAPAVLEGVGSRSIVDQLVYQLLEAVAEASEEDVQISATYALLELQRAIKSRTLLASLLPRTVSTLVKVLRSSTQARRTRKVLVAYLDLLTEALRNVLADGVASDKFSTKVQTKSSKARGADDEVVLDKSWFDATAAQIDLALTQVVKLRTHDSPDVAEALLNLCLTVIDDCSQTLAQSVPLMVETLAVLCRSSRASRANSALKYLMTSRPEITEILEAKFYDWSQALPRVMQGNDDRPKQQLLKQVTTSFIALTDSSNAIGEEMSKFASILIDTVAAAIESGSKSSSLVSEAPRILPSDLVQQSRSSEHEFMPVVLSHQSQQSSAKELQSLIATLKTHAFSQNITRNLVDHLHDPDVSRKLSAAWLALQFLRSDSSKSFDVMELVEDNASTRDFSLSRPFLISDLYSNVLPFLTEYPDLAGEGDTDWRLVALSLESSILQASQLRQSYRPELVETLFPVLTLLGSSDALLQQHAMTALNLLATACEYDSASHMLIENVDYLINAVALRLNAFDVSRTSLQVIVMMIRLCGGSILPHLDDLIGSIFGALDTFHGYPGLVEQLFDVLKIVVTESSKKPAILAIQSGRSPESHRNAPIHVSKFQDILNDLESRKQRRRQSDKEHEEIISAPHRPWTAAEDSKPSEEHRSLSDTNEDTEDDQPFDQAADREEAKMSKSHQLLLNIAKSTVPHLSSPSPKVRSTLLELLQEISPLLAGHENTFLPLVNSIWPAVVSRLLPGSDPTAANAPYITRAAALTVADICRAAGDFVSSRIEALFDELEILFEKTCSTVLRSTTRQKSVGIPNIKRSGLIISPSDSTQLKNESASSPGQSSMAPYSSPFRSSDGQLLEALVTLLVTILQHVQISEDYVDKVFMLLAPLMHTERVRQALLSYNEDAVWLIENRRPWSESAETSRYPRK
ncbi:uncharacterized protein Z520_05777 [Fonsecaea multimorphosa CBS 102226]|uniref:HEAT repeat protein n=1 Tax=Fonsecaea multimorphosa CBS 102226 TaxID=1442371 RepID=A0A0D2IN87_9EURO|nr:uncharacterized protein Z520_05777 [Fonsecaea multimorphosa CBS 102226]KIX98476.1 hypothetical protein Z520_05777 [Fonsecaea multimorphosa CBS 102226]OAL24673.1 hypothetical protein AYO22_05462 [Fonsecaea multimorphosa]